MPFHAQCLGRLGQDPEHRVLPDGTAMTTVTIASNRKVKGADHTDWLRVKAFGKTAELIGKHLRKGDRALFVGRLNEERWEAKDGTKRSAHVLVADTVHFADSGSREGGAQGRPDPGRGSSYGGGSSSHSPPAGDYGPDEDIPF